MSRTAALRNFLLQGPSHRRETQKPIINRCQSTACRRDTVRITVTSTGGLVQTADLGRKHTKGGLSIKTGTNVRTFHATPRREGPPVLVLLASVLKVRAFFWWSEKTSLRCQWNRHPHHWNSHEWQQELLLPLRPLFCLRRG